MRAAAIDGRTSARRQTKEMRMCFGIRISEAQCIKTADDVGLYAVVMQLIFIVVIGQDGNIASNIHAYTANSTRLICIERTNT